MKRNGLTPAQEERLTWLAEELCEAGKEIMKILRYGYDSYNPNDPSHPGNRKALQIELADVVKAIQFLDERGDLDLKEILRLSENRTLRFMHYQDEEKNEYASS